MRSGATRSVRSRCRTPPVRSKWDSISVPTADLTLETADGPMAAFEARPDSEPRGAVIVVQEAFGVNGHIRNVTTRLADVGYHALAPALLPPRRWGSNRGLHELRRDLPALRGPLRRRHPHRYRRGDRASRRARVRSGPDRRRRVLLRRAGHVSRCVEPHARRRGRLLRRWHRRPRARCPSRR